MDLQAAPLLSWTPAGSAANAQVGCDHVVLIPVDRPQYERITKALIAGGRNNGRFPVIRGNECEEVIFRRVCLINPLITIRAEVGRYVARIRRGTRQFLYC